MAPLLPPSAPAALEEARFVDARLVEARFVPPARFADDFFAVDFFAVDFFADARFAVDRLAVAFFADDFFAVARFAVARFAVDFLADDFFAVDRFADDFLAEDFFAVRPADFRVPLFDVAAAPVARVLRRAAPLFVALRFAPPFAPRFAPVLPRRDAPPADLPLEDFVRVAMRMLPVRRCAPRVCKNQAHNGASGDEMRRFVAE